MSNSTEVQASSQPSQQTFNFEGHEVRVFMQDESPWFVAADLCKALNLKNSRVALKALGDDEKGVSSTYTLGGEQQLAVVSEGGMWTLVLRCRDAVIEGTVPYRVRRWVTNEVLPAIRKTGVFVGKPFSLNPADVLNQSEQNTLRLMLKTAAERHPKAKQGVLMVQGWSKLKSHFGVSYREIPRHEFSEAVSIIARHAAEWEVMDEELAPKMSTDDAARLDHAFAMATQAAAKVQQSVFNGVIAGNQDWKRGRFMLSFGYSDESANANVKQIEDGAYVATLPQMAKWIQDPGVLIESAELMGLATACMSRLSQRIGSPLQAALV